MSGTGWYDKGSQATVALNETSVQINALVSKVFEKWTGDATGTSTNLTVTMDAPKMISAVWAYDYTKLYLVFGIVIAAISVAAGLVVAKRRIGHRIP